MGRILPTGRVRTPNWVEDGAVLIGDAADAMNPHASQGRMQAMVDGMVLSDLLPGCLARTIPPFNQLDRVIAAGFIPDIRAHEKSPHPMSS